MARFDSKARAALKVALVFCLLWRVQIKTLQTSAIIGGIGGGRLCWFGPVAAIGFF